MKRRKTNQELQEMFHEGNFIARALYSSGMQEVDGQFAYDMQEFHNEDDFLVTKKVEGVHENVERDGQRNRSATMLVPGVNMDLFMDIGLVYDGDQSTIRGYMYHDSVTVSGTQHGEFYNIKDDKSKLEPIISKRDFMDKYRDYRESTDGTDKEHTQYNEVLANFFPESVAGLVGKDNSNETKLKLLAAKHIMQKEYGYDLPMTIMEKGEVKIFEPTLEEVAELLNSKFAEVEKVIEKNPEKTREEVISSFANNIGFDLDISDYSQGISASNLSLKGQNEVTVDELTSYLSEVTGMQKGSRFAYGIEGRLTEVINIRRKEDGLPEITDIKNHIVQTQDVENLVSLLDKELKSKGSEHTLLKDGELKQISQEVVKNISQKRSGEMKEVDIVKSKLQNYVTGSKTNMLKEFMNKVKSLFKENMISKSIDKKVSRNTGNKGISR